MKLYLRSVLQAGRHAVWPVALLFNIAAVCPAQIPTIAVNEYVIPIAAGSGTAITNGPDGALWFAVQICGNTFCSDDVRKTATVEWIGRITPAGAMTLFPLPSIYPDLTGVYGMTAGSDGAIWFTHGTGIGRITAAGAVTQYALPKHSPGLSPLSITAGPDGALWYTAPGVVGRLRTNGAVSEYKMDQLGQSIVVPERIVAGPDGALWFADGGNGAGRVSRITTTGLITQYNTGPGCSFPFDIASGPDGALWFTCGFVGIGRMTTTGVLTVYPAGNPNFCSFGPDGALWFTDNNGGNFGRITTQGVLTQYPFGALFPGLWSGPGGNMVTGPDSAIWVNALGASIQRIVVGPPDTVQPVSHVLPLPATEPPLGIPVQMSWNDAGTGVKDISLYVSDNGGPFSLWSTIGTSGNHGSSLLQFYGALGHAYGFYSIARDEAGNQESPKMTAETITLVSALGNLPMSHVLPGGGPEVSTYYNPFGVELLLDYSAFNIQDYTIYVSDNGGPFTAWITTANVRTPNGNLVAIPFTGIVGHSYGFYSIARDVAGNQEAAKTKAELTVKIAVDTTKPLSNVSPLPVNAPAPDFTVQWYGRDTGAGIRSYTIYVSDNGGPFTTWLTVAAPIQGQIPSQQATFPGLVGHTYRYFSIAEDWAGNVENPKAVAEAVTQVAGGPDSTKPVSHVSPLPATAPALNFTVQWSGTDTGSGIRDYTIFVSVNGGPFTAWLTQTKSTEAVFTGDFGHTYGFFSTAWDFAGNQEDFKSAAEAATQVPVRAAADVNGDAKVDCADVAIVKASFGKRTGQPGFDSRADLNSDGIVDIRDLATVTKALPVGTSCP